MSVWGSSQVTYCMCGCFNHGKLFFLFPPQMWKDDSLPAVCCFGWTEVFLSQLSPAHGDVWLPGRPATCQTHTSGTDESVVGGNAKSIGTGKSQRVRVWPQSLLERKWATCITVNADISLLTIPETYCRVSRKITMTTNPTYFITYKYVLLLFTKLTFHVHFDAV